jgi:hypothetical protein
VFESAAERQGAYDFLESPHTNYESVAATMGVAAAKRSVGLPYVVVPLDHCSLSLVEKTQDPADTKDFGGVGASKTKTRGLHAVNALALTPEGVPLGLGAVRFWNRGVKPHGRSRRERALAKLEDTELGHWAWVIGKVTAQYAEHAPSVTPWFQLDRGGDSWRLMSFLAQEESFFTVRARANRRVADEHGCSRRALDILSKSKLQGVLQLNVTEQPKRAARVARLHVRAAPVTLRLRNPGASQPVLMPVYAVWVREVFTTPKGEKPIEWLLWTSVKVESFDEAALVVRNYALRWRIEDFHKTWKSGACDVESLQLRNTKQASLWATVLGAVAARIERLKHLARTEPHLPAKVELTAFEIQALVLLKRATKKRTERVSNAPTIGQAVRWIADLGGYSGQPSSGPPGSIVIRRGLEKVTTAASLLAALKHQLNDD